MSNPLEGRVFWSGDEPYEQHRRAAVWHAGTPNRFPAVIVQAESVDDVVAAIRLAQQKGMKLAVRSGGHSWSGSHLRDGIVLLDVSHLRDCSIDREAILFIKLGVFVGHSCRCVLIRFFKRASYPFRPADSFLLVHARILTSLAAGAVANAAHASISLRRFSKRVVRR